jgi:hypothetical protein
MRRLYFQVYLTVAASLVVFGVLISVLWMVVSERADNRDLLERERVFEAFYRPARTRESGNGGGGLGLAIKCPTKMRSPSSYSMRAM